MLLRNTKVINGVHFIEIPQENLYILCGSPADVVKHLMKRGLITTQQEKKIPFETGPNVILLSDFPIQNGEFSNLSEFPILQMLYRQGMLIPNHPNSNKRPIVIGTPEQISAQKKYIFYGTYGLTTVEDLLASGVPLKLAEEYIRVKYNFAFKKFTKQKKS